MQDSETPAHIHLLLDKIRALSEFNMVQAQLRNGKSPEALGLPRSARLPFLAALHSGLNRPILLVTHRADHALALFDELGFWLQATRFLFPEPNPLFYERGAWGGTVRRDRLRALISLAAYLTPFVEKPSVHPIVISSARALMTRTLPQREFLTACRKLTLGMVLQPDTLRRELVDIGYERENTVLSPGQFSTRGGILDLWPSASDQPVRLDFFGEEIEAIRTFDPTSQRTTEYLESVFVAPAREFISRRQDSGQRSKTIQEGGIQPSRTFDAMEFDIPLLHRESATLLDYFPQNALILVNDLSLVEDMTEEIEEQAVKLRQVSITDGTLSPDFPLPYVPWTELKDDLETRGAMELGRSSLTSKPDGSDGKDLSSNFRHDERFSGRLKPFMDYLESLVARGETIVVVSRQSARLKQLRIDAEYPEGSVSRDRSESLDASDRQVHFVEASLSEGFVIDRVHLITDSEIFGWDRPQPRSPRGVVSGTPEAFYADLQSGDYVAHIDHGVGLFLGLVQRNLDGHEREYLAMEYGGGGQLFVPVHQADRLTRYVGSQGVEPVLDRLGGREWHERKSRVKEAVLEVAQEMLGLHAHRQVINGYAFKPDTSWQQELEDSFPYVETPDQTRAMAEIKRDMESSRPMDRLLCGDVGYGKTELALRAAFKAVMDGRQTGMLVPTTVLAQQHYERFLERLAAFPVKVEMLSRFRSPREQADILLRLAIGEIDIVIGTHRLISSDVRFKDLGLVIIDEEQRFGVTHKEHLKHLRTEVDVLTLTATPIPRTLYMALTGVRDISNLNTPPEERLPIVTHVGPYSPQLARQAIVRELERGGQVFFVHNRVNTIQAMRMHLAQLVPEARVDVGHGQMPEHDLADVMHRFNAGQIDILLSTTIIESGLDIPNANTLIVDRADTFGLAQLYQLRGRVGRGVSRAYAYFFRHRKLPTSPESQKRLEAIAENTELGSGYSIAMRDLEIRGAGELLGTRQHGHIQAVGFHLYTRLLADAIREIRRVRSEKGGIKPGIAPLGVEIPEAASSIGLNLNQPIWMPVTVEMPLAVGIPAEYIADSDLRLRLYRRIADIRDEAEIDALSSEFIDRFGLLPEMVQNLLYQMRIKLRAEKIGLSSISWEAGQIVLRFPPTTNGKDQPRFPDLGPGIRGGKGAYWCKFGKDADWKINLLQVLNQLNQRNAAAV